LGNPSLLAKFIIFDGAVIRSRDTASSCNIGVARAVGRDCDGKATGVAQRNPLLLARGIVPDGKVIELTE